MRSYSDEPGVYYSWLGFRGGVGFRSCHGALAMSLWNWQPVKPVFMDIETQSAASITKLGAKAYLRDPSTRLLSVVFKHEGTLVIWVPPGRGVEMLTSPSYPVEVTPEVPAQVAEWLDQGGTLVAHNAEGFDSLAWEKFTGRADYWCDTVHMCRQRGLPASLDKASRAVGGPGKHEGGDEVLTLLCKLRYAGASWVYPRGTPALWQKLIEYNVQDVQELERIFEYCGRPFEPHILAAHTRVADRGVKIDVPYVVALKEAWAQFRQDRLKDLPELTDEELSASDAGSHKKIKAWAESVGVVLTTLERKVVERFIGNEEAFPEVDRKTAWRVGQVLQARMDAVRASASKLDRVLKVLDPDERVRGWPVYYGAHTGRFSARDLQPHNFARGVAGLDVEWICNGPITLDRISLAASRAGSSVGDALATLNRGMIVGNLRIADYAQIEARVLAWFANESKLLQTFSDHKRDPYSEMATKVFGRPVTKADKALRFVGKEIVLGCGYGMGIDKFKLMCEMKRIDLIAAGTSAESCVMTYRNEFPGIINMWWALDSATKQAVSAGWKGLVNRCYISMQNGDLTIMLPSGRILYYREPRIAKHPPKWDPQGTPVDNLYYTSALGFTKSLYGGLLTENIVQATARDIMCEAMALLPDVILHVHDELVGEDGIQLLPMAKLMSVPPEWASGVPLRVEGFTNPRYTKQPWASSETADFMLGRQL